MWVRVWVRVCVRVWVSVWVWYWLGYGLELGLSGRSGNSYKEPLGSGNSDQRPPKYQNCYCQH